MDRMYICTIKIVEGVVNWRFKEKVERPKVVTALANLDSIEMVLEEKTIAASVQNKYIDTMYECKSLLMEDLFHKDESKSTGKQLLFKTIEESSAFSNTKNELLNDLEELKVVWGSKIFQLFFCTGN